VGVTCDIRGFNRAVNVDGCLCEKTNKGGEGEEGSVGILAVGDRFRFKDL